MGFNFDARLSPDNGASGAVPVTPAEWRAIGTRVLIFIPQIYKISNILPLGIDTDVKAYNLLDYLYRNSVAIAFGLSLFLQTFC